MSLLRQWMRSLSRKSLLADVPKDLGLNQSCRRSFEPAHNAVSGCVRQPCRRLLAFLRPVSMCSQPFGCGFNVCLCNVHSAADPLESCNGSKQSDLQESSGIPDAANALMGSNRAVFNGENTREHQPSFIVMRNFCSTDEALPLQYNVDIESDTRLLGSSAVAKNRAGICLPQNGIAVDMKKDYLAFDDLRVFKRVVEFDYPEHDAESSNDSNENLGSILHLDASGRLLKRTDSPQDAKIVQDICNLLERQGFESSTEAFLYKHFIQQLSHLTVAKVILKLKCLAVAKPFFEWACRHLGLDLYSCHAFLIKLGENKLFDEMWELLDRLRDNNQQIDETTFCIFIKAYGAASMPDMAVDVIRKCNDYGVTAGNHVFTALLGAFFKLRLLDDVRLCYRKLIVDNMKLDTHLYSTLIRGFGMMGYSRDTQACFDVMLKEGLEPDLSTFSGLIEGYCSNDAMQKALSTFLGLQKIGLKPNVFIFNTLIKAFCRVGRLEDAIKLYQTMETVCLPNQATFNILLRGLLVNAEVPKVISFFQSMEREGWVDARSYVLLSSGLQERKQTEEMLKLLWILFDTHGFANRDVCNALLYNLSQLGQLDKAEKLFEGMAEALESPNISTHAIMIGAYCRAEKLNKASALILELKERGYKPTAYCYIPIISLMLKKDEVINALKWVEEMLEFGLEVTPVTYERLLKKLCMQSMVEEAVKLCDIIVDKKIEISVNTTFKAMKCQCKLHGAEAANACFRTMYKRQVLPKTKAVLQALAVMDTMMPICKDK